MVTVVQGKVCAKNHPDRLSRLATIHQRYRRTDRQTDFLWHRPDLTVGQKARYINTLTFTFTFLSYRIVSYRKTQADQDTEIIIIIINRQFLTRRNIVSPLQGREYNPRYEAKAPAWKCRGKNYS